jgi:hypothetical protein
MWDTPDIESTFIEKYVVSRAASTVVFKTLCDMSFIDWWQAQEDKYSLCLFLGLYLDICSARKESYSVIVEVQKSQ